jgi:phage gpG-like protein
MMHFNMEGVVETSQALADMPGKVHDALVAKIIDLSTALVNKVRASLSGAILQTRSGALRDSIQVDIEDTSGAITATIGSYGVRYAAIQEFGGKTAPHDIYPSKGQALAFIDGGRTVFARVVHHPGSVIPAHRYLGQAIDDMRPEIIRAMGEAAVEAAIL